MKPSTSSPTTAPPNAAEIERWLSALLANRLKLDSVDPEHPLSSYGVDSMVAMRLLGQLEKWLDRSLPATLFFEYPNIRELANALASGRVSDGDEYAPPDADCY